ncbi:unnamed protein product [Urochloa humidicola]
MESSRRKLAAAGGTTSHDGVLPLGVLFDVLVRLQANEICRLRTVCRPWRSLTLDPVFIKAHAARHLGPLVVSFRDDPDDHVHLLDPLSGHVIKRVPIPKYHTLLRSRLDLIGVAYRFGSGSCSVIDPATGAVVSHMPESDQNSLRDRLEPWSVWEREPERSVFALGRVHSEYKMLRISCLTGYEIPDHDAQVCSVLTVYPGGGHTDWRSTRSPEFLLDMRSGVVVGSTVYYFWADIYTTNFCKDLQRDGLPECIASFDLQCEFWDTVEVPHLDLDEDDDDDNDKFDEYIDMWSRSTLAELKGYLVLAHDNRFYYSSCLDLWFLIGVGDDLWVKKYSIRAPESAIPEDKKFLEPLLLLDDGRIIIFLPSKGALLLYDPKTNGFSKVETRCIGEVGLYTESLLSLPKVDNLQYL